MYRHQKGEEMYVGELCTSLHTPALAKGTEGAYVEVSPTSGLDRDAVFAV